LHEQIVAALPLVTRILRFIGSRHRLSAEEADEFGGYVRLKLVERGDAIIAGFQRRSSFETYMSVVLQRMFLDFREGLWRSRRSIAPAPSDESELAADPVPDPVEREQDTHAAARVEAALARALARLPAQDAVLVRLRIVEGMTMASVAQVLKCAAKTLYRRIDRIYAELRGALEAEGIGADEVRKLIGRAEFGIGWENSSQTPSKNGEEAR